MQSLLLFVHIEKAAGTSLHRILQDRLGNYHVLKPHPKHGEYISPEELNLILSFFPKINGLGSHRIRPFLDYENKLGRKIQYITVVRNPIERIVSHYFHHMERGIAQYSSLQEFLSIPYFQNFMCKKLSGVGDAATTIDLIKRKQIIVLFPELISDVFNSPIRENQGHQNSQYKKLIEANLTALEYYNSADISLFKFLQSDYNVPGATREQLGLKRQPILSNRLYRLKSRFIQEIVQRAGYYFYGRGRHVLKRGY